MKTDETNVKTGPEETTEAQDKRMKVGTDDNNTQENSSGKGGGSGLLLAIFAILVILAGLMIYSIWGSTDDDKTSSTANDDSSAVQTAVEEMKSWTKEREDSLVGRLQEGKISSFPESPSITIKAKNTGDGNQVVVVGGAEGWINPSPARGERGPAGPQGQQGERGPAGKTGSPGPPGPQGETGKTGKTGPRGSIGPRGTEGKPAEPQQSKYHGANDASLSKICVYQGTNQKKVRGVVNVSEGAYRYLDGRTFTLQGNMPVTKKFYKGKVRVHGDSVLTFTAESGETFVASL